MSEKRARDEGETSPAPEAKKRKGFRVGPENLPDGPWRRKVTKVKKDLIHKAKVKKAYAKIKSHEEEKHAPEPHLHDAQDGEAEAPITMHPDRQAMLDTSHAPDDTRTPQSPPNHPKEPQESHSENPPAEDPPSHSYPDPEDSSHRNIDGYRPNPRGRRPGYFDKQLAQAGSKREQAEAREKEFQRRNAERERKVADRQRFRKLAKSAHKLGPNGQRKLGRESVLLLEKAKKLMAKN